MLNSKLALKIFHEIAVNKATVENTSTASSKRFSLLRNIELIS